MDNQLAALVEHKNDNLEKQPGLGEPESKFSCWMLIAKRVGDEIGRGDGENVVSGYPVLQR